MNIQTEKKFKEKEQIKNDVKVLKMLQEDFDPELYIQEKKDQEVDNEDEGEGEGDNNISDNEKWEENI
jgi:hypothetical protein